MEYTIWLSMKTVVQVALATYGLAIYAIVLMPLIKFRKALFYTPFYTICFAMAFADIAQQIRYVILCTRFPILPYTDSFYLQVDGFLGRTFWYLATCIELLIALERTVIVFCKPGSRLVKINLYYIIFNKYNNKGFIQILTNTRVVIALVIIFIAIVAANVCVLTDMCKYVYHPDKAIVFYDTNVPSAVLHNKIMDWGIQPTLIVVTIMLYIVTGVRIMKVRNKVQETQGSSSNSNFRKSKLENRLFLQGLLVTLPHAAVVVLYHIIFYVPNAPALLLKWLDFSSYALISLGLDLNPTLHLVVNKDLRMKTVQYWCSSTLGLLEKSSQLPAGNRVSKGTYASVKF